MQGDVKSRPILFNTAMVQAILDGRKTVTRRVIKEIPNFIHYGTRIMDWGLPEICVDEFDGEKLNFCVQTDVDDCRADIAKPKYHIGDVLWVRETFNADWCDHVIYKADGGSAIEAGYSREPKWRPSIHMPKEAARIFLKVTDIRVERLQDMKTDDVIKEGVYNENELHYYGAAKTELAFDLWVDVWNSTTKKKDLPDFGWDANPWVWVVEFEVVSEREEK